MGCGGSNPDKVLLPWLFTRTQRTAKMEHFVGAVVGTVGIILTLIGCTWKLSGRLSNIETSLDHSIAKVEEVHTTVTTHSKECDGDRCVTSITLAQHAKRIEKLEGGMA